MNKMHVLKNIGGMEGLCLLEPAAQVGSGEELTGTFDQAELYQSGLNPTFVQDNQVFSYKGVLRGLHVHKNRLQRKLIRVIAGCIYDVVVDLRRESNSFKRWFGLELSGDNRKQLYIPEGFAHGYLVLSESAEVLYKVSEYYIPGDEIGIAWNSKELSIQWPKIKGAEYIMTNDDANNKPFSEADFY